MPTEIAYKIVVESDLADKSVGTLKQDFKDLTDQLNRTKIGTEEYKKTLSSLGVVKGGLQDLKQQIQALNPERTVAAFAKVGSTVASGFAAGQAAVALFGGESEDLMKVLVKVQAATALASGIQGLTGMGKALETAGLAMKAFALSNPFTAIAAGVVALVAVIYGMVQAFDDTQQIADELRASNEHLEESMKNLKDETALTERGMKALGKTEREVLDYRNRQRQIEIENIQEQLRNINELQRTNEITDEDLKKRFELEDRLNILRMTQKIEELELTKKQGEDSLKITEDNLDKAEKIVEEKDKKAEERRKQLLEEDKDFYKRYIQDVYVQNKVNEYEFDQQASKDNRELAAEDADFFKRYITDVYIANAQASKGEIALAKTTKEKKLEHAQQYLNATKGISDAIFKIALNGAKGNSAKELEIKKKQFKIDKAFSIAEISINTAQAIMKAAPIIPLQIAMGVLGAAQIAAVLSTKFEGESGGGEGGGSPNIGIGGGGGSSAEPPSFKQPDNTGVNRDENGDFTSFNRSEPLKVFVTETDISGALTRVKVIEERAQFK